MRRSRSKLPGKRKAISRGTGAHVISASIRFTGNSEQPILTGPSCPHSPDCPKPKAPRSQRPSGPVPRLGERLTAKRASALLLRTRSNANQAWEEGLEAAEDTRRPLRLWEA